MAKEMLDLSEKKNAQASMNKTALVGVWIMNAIIALAYLLEVVKQTRTIGSYLIVVALTMIPCIVAQLLYKKAKDAQSVRYVSGVGFAILYGYIMLTTTTDISFCYIIVLIEILMVYVDLKFLASLSFYAVLINIIVVIKKAVSGNLNGVALTNAEVILACLILTSAFIILAIKKIDRINQANIDKADKQKVESEKLLQKTLQVAGAMTGNISRAESETQNLNTAIGATQQAMEELTACAEEETAAIHAQMESTEKINDHIHGVELSVDSIVKEVNNAEENLNTGSGLMKDLLKQVQVSENSSVQVAKKMNGLKDAVDQMQEIMTLISGIADQTGLLALNASIEAARAGEAGKGFAVVATEISNLSSQTNDATADINELIIGIVRSVTEVTESMESLLESSRLQNEYVDQTAANFNNIRSNTQSIINQVSGLKDTVDVVTEANAQISENIQNVADITKTVVDEASQTLEFCNTNLETVSKVTGIMKELMTDAGKLQN